jgi:hypothetical protein
MKGTKMTEPAPYNEAFPVGTEVRVANRSFLEDFMATWKYHHRLVPDQLLYADREATVKEVGFYHGGDPVYALDGVPGLWLEQCLRPANPNEVADAASRADAIVSLQLYSEARGGRKSAISDGHLAIFVYQGKNYECRFLLRGVGPILPGGRARVPIKFLRSDIKERLKVGSRFTIRELNTIGEGVIESNFT